MSRYKNQKPFNGGMILQGCGVMALTYRREVTMSVNGITPNTVLTTVESSYKGKSGKTGSTDSAVKNTSQEAAVYEKSDETGKASGSGNKVSRETVEKLKADAEARMASLKSLVEKMMTKQGQTAAKAGILDFENGTNLAEIFRNLEVDEETRAQAQADIAEDGYWGVEQTSERMLEFAKGLAGNDPAAAKDMLNAIKKGFEEAGLAWGEDLPEISQRTMDATLEKVNNWISELEGNG